MLIWWFEFVDFIKWGYLVDCYKNMIFFVNELRIFIIIKKENSFLFDCSKEWVWIKLLYILNVYDFKKRIWFYFFNFLEKMFLELIFLIYVWYYIWIMVKVK